MRPFPSPNLETVQEDPVLERRSEVLSDTMGLSSYGVRLMAEGEGVPTEGRQTGKVPAASRPRRPSYRGRRSYPELTDRDIELRESLAYSPTAAELQNIAGPEDPGWQEAHRVVDGIAEEAVVRRAIEHGQEHLLPAIRRAREERRARSRGPAQ